MKRQELLELVFRKVRSGSTSFEWKRKRDGTEEVIVNSPLRCFIHHQESHLLLLRVTPDGQVLYVSTASEFVHKEKLETFRLEFRKH